MNIEKVKNSYKISKLTKRDNLNGFSCGLDDMDDFLKNDALTQQEENLNVTYLAKCDNQIIGFFSLLSDSIRLQSFEEEYNLPYESCPAIKIGRLAVDENYNRNGIGTRLLDDICFEIKNISERLGVRFITVDAYCTVRSFYYKSGFNHFKLHNKKKLMRTALRNDDTTVALYKDIKRI